MKVLVALALCATASAVQLPASLEDYSCTPSTRSTLRTLSIKNFVKNGLNFFRKNCSMLLYS